MPSVKSLLFGSSRDQARDTGMAFVFICLILAYVTEHPAWILASMALLLLAMVWPDVYKPAAFLWFGLARLLGAVVSRLLLSVLFFGLIVPMGCVRRLAGKDPMQRKAWRKGKSSVFRSRDRQDREADMTRPF
jgi:hypothetical protein